MAFELDGGYIGRSANLRSLHLEMPLNRPVAKPKPAPPTRSARPEPGEWSVITAEVPVTTTPFLRRLEVASAAVLTRAGMTGIDANGQLIPQGPFPEVSNTRLPSAMLTEYDEGQQPGCQRRLLILACEPGRAMTLIGQEF